MRLGYEDAVLNLHRPVADQAAEEVESVLFELYRRLDLGAGPIGVVGGSIGAAVSLLVLTEHRVDIAAAVLVSPIVQLRRAVEAMERQLGVSYAWSDRSLEVARRLHFVDRADEIARRPSQPAILLLVGQEEDTGFREPAVDLRDALAHRYADRSRVDLITVPGMGHALAEEPGIAPAPRPLTLPRSTDWQFDGCAIILRRYLRSEQSFSRAERQAG